MMTATECPTAERLKAYSLGRLPDVENQALFEHLRHCETCQAEMETVDDADDSLIGDLRGVDEDADWTEEPEFNHAMAKALGALAAVSELSGDDLQATPRMIGEYEIVRMLGRGGMGKVLLARHTKLGRQVAIKVLAGHRLADKRMRDRFDAEMKAIGQLSHPNIVTAHDAREIDGTAVLVTEYIDGYDLGELVQRTGPLSIPDACQIVRKVAAALQYTSDQGFVHRDVKPSNIMISRGGEVKLLDLGLARYESGREIELTGTGQAIGTADYVSPEQVTDGRSVDGRSDIYSLGATLFKLLTSVAPFEDPSHQTAFAKMTAHVSEIPPSLSDQLDDCPPALARLVDSMLSKDPGKRPQSSGEVARTIARWADGGDLVERVRWADRSLESTRPLPNAVNPDPKPWQRKSVPMTAAIGLGMIGMMVGLMMGTFIRITYPDNTVLDIPISGAKVEVTQRSTADQANERTDEEAGPIADQPIATRDQPARDSSVASTPLLGAAAKDRLSDEISDGSASLAPRGSLADQIQGIWVLEIENDRPPRQRTVLAFNRNRWHRAWAGGATTDPCRTGSFELTAPTAEAGEWQLSLISTIVQSNKDKVFVQNYKAVLDDSGKLLLQSINSDPKYKVFHYAYRRFGDVSATSSAQYQAMLVGLLTDPRRPGPLKVMKLSQSELDEIEAFLGVRSDSATVVADDLGTPAGLLRQLEGVWEVVSNGEERGPFTSGMLFAFEGDQYHAVSLDNRLTPVLSYGAIERIQKDGRGIHLVASDKVADRTVVFDLEFDTANRVVLKFDPFGKSGLMPFQGTRPRSPMIKPPTEYRLRRIGVIPTSGDPLGGFMRHRPSSPNPYFLKAVSMLQQVRELGAEQFLAGSEPARDAAARTRSTNNLKQLAIAFHNFQDTYRKFPGSANRREGSSGVASEQVQPFSWRVALLPFLDQSALYEQYKFDEPWDSESNLKLLDQMPEIYRSPRATSDQAAGHANYLGFATGNSALGKDDGVKIRDIRDGTSNTLLLVETKDAVPWTKPQDLEDYAAFYEPVVFAMADGSVRERPKLDPEFLQKIISRDGGEIIDW